MTRQLSRRIMVAGASALALAVVFSFGPVAAQSPAKRPVSYDVMDYWRSIQGTKLSQDGQWLAYALTAPGDDGELVVRNLKTNQELRSPRGTTPVFTPDAKFVIFTIVPTKADDERANRGRGAGAEQTPAAAGRTGGAGGGQNARNSMGIMSLPGGQVTTVEQIATFRLPEESSTWLAFHKGRAGGGRNGRAGGRAGGGGGRAGATPAAQPAQTGAEGENAAQTSEKRKDPGTDLTIRNLATGEDTTIPDVVDFAWDKTGAQIAYTVSSADGARDGAFVRRTADKSTITLHTGKGNYKNPAFDDAGRQLAFLSDQAEYDKKVSPYRLYYWKTGDAAATELVAAGTRGMPQGFVVSDNFAPRFSEDNARLYLGTAPAPKPPRDENAPAPTRVDLWSYKDAQIQPMQQVRANQDRTRNYRAVVQLADKRFMQLASPDLPNVNPGDDPVRALGTSDVPYQQQISWDQTYNDVYLVDLKSGLRKKILEHWGATATLSPGGNYVLYFDESKGQWFSYKVADGTRVNLTATLPVKFYDEGHDSPDAPPSLGVAGWTEGDKSVLLNDQFDIWEIKPDGSGARMVTAGEGRKQGLVFRYRALDAEAGGGPGGGRGGGAGAGSAPISPTKPLLLATTNDETRASGFYRTTLASSAAPEKIMMIDKQVGAPTKAKNADVVVFTEQTFEEFPDLWASDSNFASPRKVSNANPQQSEFVWGKAERIKYINGDGKVLSAMLIKPDNFDPSKKYPLMVYIYEELSEGLNGYHAPNVGTSINVTRYVSNGYVVLEPDIVYETGYPGPSAMKCVIPAINTVVAQGYIDPKRIGIQGHSWGGYQITLHDHADQHLRGRRGRRIGVEHDQRVRRHPLGHRAWCASSSTRRRRAASARRRGTTRCSSSRTRRSSGSRRSTRRT